MDGSERRREGGLGYGKVAPPRLDVVGGTRGQEVIDQVSRPEDYHQAPCVQKSDEEISVEDEAFSPHSVRREAQACSS